MRPRDSLCLFLNCFTLTVISQSTSYEPQITPKPLPTEALPSQSIPPVPSISTIPASFSSTTPTPYASANILSSAEYLLGEVYEYLHTDLRKRQGGIAATVAAPQAPATVATQMSPVTTYGPDHGWPQVVYTQLFVAVPDQWPSPSAGTIGLGTIQGQVGVVKTKSKRYAGPEPTAQVIRIKGREVFVS